MTTTFDSLPWHDAELLAITIDRRRAGICDEVQIRVAWPDGGEATALFSSCYAMTAEMNFGVICNEQILSAMINDMDPGLVAIRARWEPLGVSLDRLQCYQFETSSTASVIKIYALRFDLK